MMSCHQENGGQVSGANRLHPDLEKLQIPELDALRDADLSFLDYFDWTPYLDFQPTAEEVENALKALDLPSEYPPSTETQAPLAHCDHNYYAHPTPIKPNANAPIVSDLYEQEHLNCLVAFLNDSIPAAPQLGAKMGDDDPWKVDHLNINSYDQLLDDLDELNLNAILECAEDEKPEALIKPSTISAPVTPQIMSSVTVREHSEPPSTVLEAVHIKTEPGIEESSPTVACRQSYYLRDRARISRPFKLKVEEPRPQHLTRQSPFGKRLSCLLEPKSEPEDSVTMLPTIKKKKKAYIPRALLTPEQREAARQKDRERKAKKLALATPSPCTRVLKKRPMPTEVKKPTKRTKK